jgi:hypothetical protein
MQRPYNYLDVNDDDDDDDDDKSLNSDTHDIYSVQCKHVCLRELL